MTSQRGPRMLSRWPDESMNIWWIGRGRLVVGIVVPADVLARELVAVALVGHHVEDRVAIGRDAVAEVVALDHVLRPATGDRLQLRVDLERAEAVRGAGLVRRGRRAPTRPSSSRRSRPRRGRPRAARRLPRTSSRTSARARARIAGARRGASGGRGTRSGLDRGHRRGPVSPDTVATQLARDPPPMVIPPRRSSTGTRSAPHRTAPHRCADAPRRARAGAGLTTLRPS